MFFHVLLLFFILFFFFIGIKKRKYYNKFFKNFYRKTIISNLKYIFNFLKLMESTSFRNLHCFETQDQNMEIFSNLSPTTVGKNLESSSKFGNNTNRND